MNRAATRARLVRPSAPGTQLAATVELPRQMTSSTTNTASGRVPDGGWSRAGRVLDQADSISRPQQPGEVVPPADDVEVHVGAEVEAQVGLGRAEAGGVDVEGEQRGPPAADALHGPDPGGVRAGRDHGEGAAGQAADPL